MPRTVRYGTQRSISLDLPDEALFACGEMAATLADPAAVLRGALAAPLDFPPLAKATVPGDRIAIALDQGVPQAPALVGALVQYLLDAGAAAELITIVRRRAAEDAGEADPRSELSPELQESIALQAHDPEKRGQQGMLGSMRDGTAVYLNRTVLDADLVVPVGCLRCEGTLGYYGRHGGLFPTFSDSAAEQRYRKPAGDDPQRALQTRNEIDEVGWLIGAPFTIQVVPGSDGGLLHVLAGETASVFKRGQELCQQAWSCAAPRRASLVLATVTGPASEQTWENLARALAAAERLVADGGSIAICSEIAAEPGPALRRLAGTDDVQGAMRRIRKECPPDALPAAELAHARSLAKLYLLSLLDETLVEDLGMASVERPEEIARLARRHASCVVIEDAQFAAPWAPEPDA